MLTFLGVAVAGLALGLLAEVLRRRFGTRDAVLAAAASCVVALALWVPHRDSDRALWLFLTFAGMFYLTDLLEPTSRRSPSTPQ
jgi:NhaP-type Na+/H+ or K+/H+ antiporter